MTSTTWRDIGIIGEKETPGPDQILGPPSNADAWTGSNGRIRDGGAGCQVERARLITQVDSVKRPVDRKSIAEPTGAAGQQMRWGTLAQAAHLLDATLRGKRTNQNCAYATRGMCDDVQARVHPIDQVHVGVAGPAKHTHRAPAGTTKGVRCRVLLTTVRLDLHDPSRKQLSVEATYQPLSQQPARNYERLMTEKVARQRVEVHLLTTEGRRIASQA